MIDSAPNNTFLGRAIADLNDEQGGRFGVAKAPAVVTGTGAAMPGIGPQWSKDGALVGDEPPLGFSVDAMEPIELTPATLLRQQADQWSRILGGFDQFWQDRLGRLIDTLGKWADEMEGQ
jgi:hypothetical protein